MDQRLGVSKNGILDLPQLLCEKEMAACVILALRHVHIRFAALVFHFRVWRIRSGMRNFNLLQEVRERFFFKGRKNDLSRPFFVWEISNPRFWVRRETAGFLKTNKTSRVEELCTDLAGVWESGALSSKYAHRLQGRMQFADAQLKGRTGKRCLRALGDFAEGRRFKLLPKDCLFLSLFATLLKQSVPREIKAWICTTLLSSRTLAMRGTATLGPAVLVGHVFSNRKPSSFP